MDGFKRSLTSSSSTSFPTRREILLLTTLLVALLLWPKGRHEEPTVVVYGEENYESYFDQEKSEVEPVLQPQDAQSSWAPGNVPGTSIVQHQAGDGQS